MQEREREREREKKERERERELSRKLSKERNQADLVVSSLVLLFGCAWSLEINLATAGCSVIFPSLGAWFVDADSRPGCKSVAS